MSLYVLVPCPAESFRRESGPGTLITSRLSSTLINTATIISAKRKIFMKKPVLQKPTRLF
jgi:hypothetical protein